MQALLHGGVWLLGAASMGHLRGERGRESEGTSTTQGGLRPIKLGKDRPKRAIGAKPGVGLFCGKETRKKFFFYRL